MINLNPNLNYFLNTPVTISHITNDISIDEEVATVYYTYAGANHMAQWSYTGGFYITHPTHHVDIIAYIKAQLLTLTASRSITGLHATN